MHELDRPLFTPAATRRARGLLLAALLLVITVPALGMAWLRTPTAAGVGREVRQPLPFDHRHHVLDAGISCAFCHRDAGRRTHAGLPAPELCMRCHQQVLATAPMLAPLRLAHAERQSIVWRRVNDLPDFTFFHHGVHVSAGIGCDRCHGTVEHMSSVYQARRLDMGWCLDCHLHPDAALPPHPGPRHCSACHR